MKEIFKSALNNSYSYQDYRKIITDLLQEGKTTGTIQSEALVNYSRLNETRMHRLDKTIVIDLVIISKLKLIQSQYIWLVIAEGWCGDAAQILPILNKMSEVSDNIDLKVVFRDDNEALMNLFLTNGNKSIPKLIILDKNSLDVIADWGPRPIGAVEIIENYKEKFGIIDDTIKSELQMWYLHDKGLSTQKEITELMSL
jgi:thiol-disulfide isomerase/thioredoxin